MKGKKKHVHSLKLLTLKRPQTAGRVVVFLCIYFLYLLFTSQVAVELMPNNNINNNHQEFFKRIFVQVKC